MKKHTILLGMVLAVCSAFPQSPDLPGSGGMSVLLPPSHIPLKIQTIQERMVSMELADFDGVQWVPSFNLTYNYSGKHGQGDFDYINLSNYMTGPLFDEAVLTSWDGVVWTNLIQGLNEFNAEDLRTELTANIWNLTDWEPATRITYTYDALDQIIEYEVQVYNAGVYENAENVVFEFDGARLLSETHYSWDGADWVNWNKVTYTYKTNGLLDYETELFWNGVNWENSARFVYYYDAFDVLIEKLIQHYSLAWINYDKYIYEYSPEGYLEIVYRYFWNGLDWDNSSRWIVTNNAANNPEEIINQYWDGFVWQENTSYTYTYESFEDGSTAVEEDPVSYAMKLYPNPANEYVDVMIKTPEETRGQLQMVDMAGNLVASISIHLNAGHNIIHLDLESLAIITGQYFVSVQTRSKIYKGMLIVQ